MDEDAGITVDPATCRENIHRRKHLQAACARLWRGKPSNANAPGLAWAAYMEDNGSTPCASVFTGVLIGRFALAPMPQHPVDSTTRYVVVRGPAQLTPHTWLFVPACLAGRQACGALGSLSLSSCHSPALPARCQHHRHCLGNSLSEGWGHTVHSHLT